MELKRYDEIESFPFGNLEIRDMTPSVFREAKMAQVEVPIGADNPPYAAAENEKVYVGMSGDIEFKVGGERVRIRRGDVLVINRGEQYSYHNGGYEPGRLFVIQAPAGDRNGYPASGTT